MRDGMQESGSSMSEQRLARVRVRYALAFALIVCLPFLGQSESRPRSGERNLNAILAYIHSGWDSLTRATNSCTGISDPKVIVAPVIYLPADYAAPEDLERMRHNCKVTIAHLPHVIHQLGSADVEGLQPPGLLYLEHKYVVPGGRFNEMYGWDSYFIIRGLLRDGRLDLARGMVDNFFFEIEHYGAVLNANRTYYLTRSQPPFLSSMVMAVHEAQTAAGQNDRAWLETAYSYVKRNHDMWTREPHLAGNTGLSRYYDFGTGPAEEALKDEEGLYRRVAGYFLLHPTIPAYENETADLGGSRTSGAAYSVRVCGVGQLESSCEPVRFIRLTADYYKGDRSMRESGFDISFRFGPYGAATHHYAPVCLNSLLFKTEKDLAELSRLLGKTPETAEWERLAEERKRAVGKYLWDEEQGMFFDYDFENARRSDYRYATTFYPLWAGLATNAQAASVIKNLNVFERPGGIVTSLNETQAQWDYPFGWAPIQLLAVEGMRRYGHDAEADRVSAEFLSTVLENFARDGTIREKYDVVARSSETNVKVGYAANVIGFGWTNAAFLELLHSLPPDKVARLEQAASGASSSR